MHAATVHGLMPALDGLMAALCGLMPPPSVPAGDIDMVNGAFEKVTEFAPATTKSRSEQGIPECGGWDSNPHVRSDNAF